MTPRLISRMIPVFQKVGWEVDKDESVLQESVGCSGPETVNK
jgi:hypothetical protein